MAEFSYDEYVKMTERRPKGQGQGGSANQGVRIQYFSLANDGDTAIVRFNIKDIEEITVRPKHTVMSQGKKRNISCLRTPDEPVEKCPLCASGEKVSWRILIPMISYETTENKVELKPVVWDSSPKLRETLKSFAMDYGDLRDYVFKITRHGKPGDTGTTYSIIPAPAKMYTPEVYRYDFSGFENYDPNNFITSKSKEDMEEFLATGVFPNPYAKKETSAEETTNEAPVVAEAPVVESQPTNTQHRTYEVPQQGTNEAPVSGPRRYTY